MHGRCLSCSKMEGNKYAEVDNLNDSIQNLSIHGEYEYKTVKFHKITT